MYTKIDYKG
jgi:hypothetical protein